MITALCVGGPKDGEVTSALHGDRISFALPGTDRAGPVEFAKYRAELVVIGGVERFLWILDGMTAEEAIERVEAAPKGS